ncbi:hypothetical protein ACFW15_31130, partial [Streptomyces sp. NPDC058953]
IRERLERGIREGDLPPDTDTATAARFYTAIVQGMSVQARDGAGYEEVARVAERAIGAWEAVTGAPARPVAPRDTAERGPAPVRYSADSPARPQARPPAGSSAGSSARSSARSSGSQSSGSSTGAISS